MAEMGERSLARVAAAAPLKQMDAAMRTEVDQRIFKVQRARNRGTRFCPIGSAPGNESHSIDSAVDGVFPFFASRIDA